mmetsp:Transcript_10516/g.20385  ORF Transcript_10516/g.20385 Transcript_10516/m.20385 type:complete len:89 (+) Transcript_10516:1-267(+)
MIIIKKVNDSQNHLPYNPNRSNTIFFFVFFTSLVHDFFFYEFFFHQNRREDCQESSPTCEFSHYPPHGSLISYFSTLHCYKLFQQWFR